MKYDLSVLITARNEEFLKRTVEDVLDKRRGKTEVIVILDGAWANPPLEDHQDVTVLYHKESVGQRAAINEAAKLSKAKFIMKLDAHCILSEGFDVELMSKCDYDWTVIPTQYNLHAFNWKCNECGNEWYQGKKPTECLEPGESRKKNEKCKSQSFKRVMVWKPRWHRKTTTWRFDSDLHFQYWSAFKKRKEHEGDVVPTMSCLGACWFLHRDRYWDIGGMDEKHGSWGQMGTELACKSWLSGGKMMTSKKSWFAHLFRTQGGDFTFPYPQSGNQVANARKHSQNMWRKGTWKGQKHPLSWLIERFWPVPGWDKKELAKIGGSVPEDQDKGIIYYTRNKVNMKIGHECRKHIAASQLPIVSVSSKPMKFGKNHTLNTDGTYLEYFKKILMALEKSTAKIIFFCEDDVLYHKSHFDFVPPKKDVYYYNKNWWRVRTSDGHAVQYDTHLALAICGYRELLLDHYRKVVKKLETEGYSDSLARRIGFEPGTHNRDDRVDDFRAGEWRSAQPILDLRHGNNITESRWSKDQFRSERSCRNWRETTFDKIPGWKSEDFNFIGSK